ncbi:hypothetical protein LMH87_006980 [Akanthomyces muscarius]|uniref:Uncharacterized protein n=1 Tax=Akanthomyces muscarius TaxID=2231603 RepID=A0A9W8QNU0_AKAMU|nr:hypothetical protein LMH87_006980 [Akanthomyces muscarius]KAJ4165346.1 hypothetical protein LMH87_006980 [Akanthomyces muscarius]
MSLLIEIQLVVALRKSLAENLDTLPRYLVTFPGPTQAPQAQAQAQAPGELWPTHVQSISTTRTHTSRWPHTKPLSSKPPKRPRVRRPILQLSTLAPNCPQSARPTVSFGLPPPNVG